MEDLIPGSDRTRREVLRSFAHYLEEYGPALGALLDGAARGMAKNYKGMATADVGRQLAIGIGIDEYSLVLGASLELLRRGDNEYVELQLSHMEVDKTKHFGQLMSDLLPVLLICAMDPDRFVALQSDMAEALQDF